jgi:hypothetical protein
MKEARLAPREMVSEAVLREESLDGATMEVRDERDVLIGSVLLCSVVLI